MCSLLAGTFASLLFAAAASASHADASSLDIDKLSTFKGARKVVVDQFGVEFVTVLKARGSGGGSSANTDARLEGVSDSAMQALADRAYQDTVAALISHEGASIFANCPRGADATVCLDAPLTVKAEGYALGDTTTAESKRSDGVPNALSVSLNLPTESYLHMIGQARDALVARRVSARQAVLEEKLP